MLMYDERELVRVYCLKMLEKGLTTGTGGNISILNREKGYYAMSPSSMDYHLIRPEDVVIIDLEGKVVDGTRKPSIEHVMHRVFYTDRDDIGAVVHTHSSYATAIACLNQPIPAVQVLIHLGGGTEVPCAPYERPGSPELAKVAFEEMKGRRATLLQNHGLIAGGETIERAMLIAEELEYVSQLYCIAKAMGTPNVLTKEQLQ